MNVNDLILQLSNYAAQHPDNGNAQVRFQSPEGMQLTWAICGANDARGMPGQTYLVLLPDGGDGGLGIKDVVQ